MLKVSYALFFLLLFTADFKQALAGEGDESVYFPERRRTEDAYIQDRDAFEEFDGTLSLKCFSFANPAGTIQSVRPHLPQDNAALVDILEYSAAKTLCTVGLEYPAENTSVRMQATQQKNLAHAFKRILQEEGILGFYKGAKPVLLRTQAKLLYQFSTIEAMETSKVMKGIDELDTSGNLRNATMALVIAAIDTVVLNPIERSKYKTLLDIKTPLPMYRGASALFAEQSLGWFIFLVGQNHGLATTQAYLGKDYENIYKPAMGLGLGAIEALLIVPFSNMRTQLLQGVAPLEFKSFIQHLKKIGLARIYFGWKPAIIRTGISSVADLYFLSHRKEAREKELKEENGFDRELR